MAMWTRVDRALDRLYDICGYIAVALLMVLTALVLASIVSRLLSVYIAGLTEFAGYSMAACVFFGMAYTFRSGGHIRVTLFTNRMSGKVRRFNDLWCLAALAVVISYLAFYLCQLAYESWLFEEISEGGDAIPLWIAQSPMAFGAAVYAVCAIHTFVRALIVPETLEAIDAGAGGEV
ncbi:MAG: TRAP transporter small permease subunit [Hyphomicrobiales bacterium]